MNELHSPTLVVEFVYSETRYRIVTRHHQHNTLEYARTEDAMGDRVWSKVTIRDLEDVPSLIFAAISAAREAS